MYRSLTSVFSRVSDCSGIFIGEPLRIQLLHLAARLVQSGRISPGNLDSRAWKGDSFKIIMPKNKKCLSRACKEHTTAGKLLLVASSQTSSTDFHAIAICLSSKHLHSAVAHITMDTITGQIFVDSH